MHPHYWRMCHLYNEDNDYLWLFLGSVSSTALLTALPLPVGPRKVEEGLEKEFS